MNILVAGGAGYIGSHMVKHLHSNGHKVVVLDSLTTGYRDAVKYGDLIMGDLGDLSLTETVFRDYQFDAVMHFAAFINVGESVTDPLKYYRNNVGKTINLLEAMTTAGVKRFIFSSSAAVYGRPKEQPISESAEKKPINPYGHTKLMVEQILSDMDRANNLKSICLRYFNAAGADPEGELGERHEPETHLIPLILRAASGRKDSVTVFGEDYDTPDGTCVRDYVHVNDLCQAHLLALEYLVAKDKSDAFNLGNGQGFSVAEVIEVAQKVTGKTIKVVKGSRREGDPDRLVADSTRATEVIRWNPEFNDLETIVTHAWNWERKIAEA